MRILPDELAAHLRTRTTTLCYCWKLTRGDGTIMGFTDHDRPLHFDGVDFEAASGFDSSAVTQELGFKVSTTEVSGALRSDKLNDADMAAGLYDNATIELWLVNWRDPRQRLRIKRGSIGEIRREDNAFSAEMRGRMHELDQEQGRLFQHSCDVDLGDERCGVDLDDARFKGAGVVHERLDNASFLANNLNTFSSGWFTQGLLRWDSGENAGLSMEVKIHHRGSRARIDLWQPMVREIATGDSFTITAGCDKTFPTCLAKFDNAINFHGFPHMPGNDFALSYGKPGK